MPLSSLGKLRLQEVICMGHPTQPGSGKAEMQARYLHLSGPSSPGAWPRAQYTADVLGLCQPSGRG